jgi:hypothetical protein
VLDQVYTLRNRLKGIAAAIDALPPETQALLRERLKD